MDSRNATIVGNTGPDSGAFALLGHVKNEGQHSNSSEKTSNNEEIMLKHKYFKEIAGIMPNIDEIHITGTGQIQEEFIKYLADTPQYKNALSSISTSNKMSDEHLAEFIKKHFN